MTNATKNEYLADEALNGVAGGLNPQPLPPGPPERSFASYFSHFAINQHSFAVNIFKFR
jgi:hypothetical protein